MNMGEADEKPREKVERLVEHGRNMVQQCSTYLYKIQGEHAKENDEIIEENTEKTTSIIMR